MPRPGSEPTPSPEPEARTTELTGWGRHPRVAALERRGEDLAALTRGASLCRGLGRAYGDAALPASAERPVANTTLADRLLDFDPESGVLRAEAGLSLGELHRLFWRRGFSAPVITGTQYVTLGGMVAADVHGKNHHRAGSLAGHVEALRLRLADDRVLEVTEAGEPELFRATLGGMGLTGHVLEVALRLERIASPWIWQESERFDAVEGVVARLIDAGRDWPFSVAWLDTSSRGRALGRGIVSVGRWAEPAAAPAAPPEPLRRLPVPVDVPSGVVGPATLRAANSFWFRRHGARLRRGIVHPERYFHPLDGLLDWNRGYGRRGFTQYQCILPRDAATLREFLELFQAAGGCSFVTVLKDFGPEGRGLLSFPKPGLTLTLDIPIADVDATEALVARLNEFVIPLGGRVYLAKDAFTRAEHFRAMEPRLEAFQRARRSWDPEGRLASALSVRLLGDEPGKPR